MIIKKFNTLNEKWKGKEVEVQKTGEYTDKTIAELKKMKSDLKKENDKYQEDGKDVPKKNKEKMSEIIFAIRAKGGWKKGEGATNEGMETENYMFFSNLKTIKRLVDEMLEMDENNVDELLSNGHNWALDHIATSKDDVEEVFNFLAGEKDDQKEKPLLGGPESSHTIHDNHMRNMESEEESDEKIKGFNDFNS
jgi:hypothetical protein